MFIGVAKIVLEVYGSLSINEKNKAIIPFVKQCQKDFNVSVDIVDEYHDIERVVLGISLVANDEKITRQRLQKILEFIDTHAPARVSSEETEIYSMS